MGAVTMPGAGKVSRVRDGAAEAKVTLGVGIAPSSAELLPLAEDCSRELSRYLSEHLPDFSWSVQPEALNVMDEDSLILLEKAQVLMERRGWRFCFILMEGYSSLHSTSESNTVYFSYSAAVIDTRALFAGKEPRDEGIMTSACCDQMIDALAMLNGLPRPAGGRAQEQLRDIGSRLAEDDLEALNAALHSLTDGMLARRVKELKGLTLYLRVALRHPGRVLKTVSQHHPLRMVFSLGRLVFAAVAALVLSLLSTELWSLGIGINVWRLSLIAAGVLLAASFYVVFQQRLYVRKVSLSLSEQAAFFNLTNFLTVLSVFFLLFVIIFALSIVVTVGVFPRYIVSGWLGGVGLGALDYLQVSLLISCLALAVGEIGRAHV